MENNRRAIIEYSLTVFVMAAFAVVVSNYLVFAELKGITVKSFMLLFFVNVFVSLVALFFDEQKLDIVISFAISIFLALIFRNENITFNLIASFMLALVLYLIRIVKIRKYLWTAITAVSLALWLFNYSDISKSVAISLIILLVYSISNFINRDYKYYLLGFALIAFFCVFMPVSDDPCKWTIVKKAITNVYEFGEKIVDETIYAFNGLGIGNSKNTTVGYSGTGQIGSGLSSREREDIIFSHDNWKYYIYLKGKSYKDFSKEGMTNAIDHNNSDNEWLVEYINALYHAGVTEEEASYFSKIINANVKYKYLRSDDVIHPMNTIVIEYKNGYIPKKKKKGFEYKLSYLLIDYNSGYFLDVINSDKLDLPAESYDTIVKYFRHIYHIDFRSIFSEEDYNELAREVNSYRESYADSILSSYLDSSFASKRTRELSYEITKGCKTNYEKAKAIEKYLRQYKYNKSIDLSKSDNYIDAFLFDAKEGYCVHYASAMALMLRIVNVPSKYTVGYAHDEHNTDIVKSNEAHAYCEAYIDGYGFMRFEATAPYSDYSSSSWGLNENYSPDAISVVESLEDVKNGLENDNYDKVDKGEEKSGLTLIKEQLISLIKNGAALIVIAIVLIVIILLMKSIKYKMMSPNDKLKYNMNKLYKMLEKKTITDENKLRDYNEVYDNYLRMRFRGDLADHKTVVLSENVCKYVKSLNAKRDKSVDKSSHKSPLTS
ncbi:MAG: hypothetical protein K5656_11390 [Lachnospiraceae bacterium]|nr:hypothetical protein [Lachnospiraceae bacterium]